MYQMKIFLFSQPTNCGKSRSLKFISGNGWFFIWIIKLPSPDNISGKGGSSFFEMEHDYQWLIHKVKLFAFETIWWRRFTSSQICVLLKFANSGMAIFRTFSALRCQLCFVHVIFSPEFLNFFWDRRLKFASNSWIPEKIYRTSCPFFHINAIKSYCKTIHFYPRSKNRSHFCGCDFLQM